MAKQRTLYYLPTYGQIGNQLAVIAHLLAFAIEYKYTIVYPQSTFFSRHLQLFQSKQNRFIFSKRYANQRLSKSLIRFLKFIFFKKNFRAFRYLVINKRFVAEKELNTTSLPDAIIVTDWLFRYYDGIKKHQDIIRREMAFNDESVINAKHKWQALQQQYPQHTFIGVHVRRGDYADWLGGIYLYENATYYKWMTQISKQVNNPLFIVCSNEELQFVNDEELKIFYSKGSPLEDLFLLSKCRYIIGPPSTFSSWAAFAGNELIRQPETKDETMQLHSFTKYYL